MRVVVVDDLPFMRQAIRDALEPAGIVCAGEGTNGVEALRLYESLRPDVMVLDITMPKMDGIAALARLMRRDPNARVVMCSALDEERLIVRAIQLGARDFVVKPFRRERVVSAVRKAGSR